MRNIVEKRKKERKLNKEERTKERRDEKKYKGEETLFNYLSFFYFRFLIRCPVSVLKFD